MRVGRALPHRAKRPHASHAPPTALGRGDSARKPAAGVPTKILYFNPEPIHRKYVDIIRQRGHDVVIASSGAGAFAMMRRQIFDALVMDCAQDTLDIQNFTAKTQGLQPSLALFLADEWGDELASGLEELGNVGGSAGPFIWGRGARRNHCPPAGDLGRMENRKLRAAI